MLTVVLSAAVILASTLENPPAQPPQVQTGAPPRDAAPPGPPTGAIRGRVLARDTGLPIARATVMVTSRSVRREPGEGPLQATTDADGRFEFTGLPAGEYRITARPGDFRASYLPQMFGQDRPSAPGRPRPPLPLTLADGETREDVTIALWRAFAVEGRIVDEFGEPMAGVPVRPRDADTDQPIPMGGPYQFTSDDRGMYRVFGLAPGSYLLCASPRQFGPPGPDVSERYVETCHPAAAAAIDAQPVTVTASDVGGVDIRLQRSRAFTVSGIALDSSGAPLARGQVSLVRIERNGTSGTGLQVRPDGQFLARGLTPGEYAIRADTRARPGPGDASDPDREMAYVPFRVDGFDIEGLLVVTRKPAAVSGRIVPRDAGALGPDPAGMRVMAAPEPGIRPMFGPSPPANVASDLTFELGGLFGPTAVRLMGLPPNWVVESVRYRGRDITDVAVDFTDAREQDRIDIVVTNRAARVSGSVFDSSGAAAAGIQIMLLPADPAKWDVVSSLRGAASGPDGAFKIGPVRAGEYLIVAIDPGDAPMMRPDRTYLERLAAIADRLTLAENDERAVQLVLRRLR